MTRLPQILIVLRVFVGFAVLGLSVARAAHYVPIAIVLIAVGLVSDILDGIIARRLDISTPQLRRMDSAADQVFWLSVLAATVIHCPDFFRDRVWQLGILLGVEALTYIVSYTRFRKEVATHAVASKIWTLTIFALLIQITATCASGTLFQFCFYAGVITRLEIIAILMLLPTWTADVPSVYHALRLRQGKPIRRNDLFNG